MKASEQQRFHELMVTLCGSFRVDATDPLLDGYWISMGDIDISGFTSAVTRALSECKHMPRPVELRELAGARSTTSRAIAAWDSFERSFTRCGAALSIDFEDALINATIRSMGGCRLMAKKTSEEWLWVRKEFERVYTDYCNHAPPEEMLAALSGRRHHDVGEHVRIPIDGAPEWRRVAGVESPAQITDGEKAATRDPREIIRQVIAACDAETLDEPDPSR